MFAQDVIFKSATYLLLGMTLTLIAVLVVVIVGIKYLSIPDSGI